MIGVKDNQRRGCIYMEYHNRGRNRGGTHDNHAGWHRVRGVGMTRNYLYRWVAEISYYGKRYRCRSAHYDRVHAWLDDMKQKFNNPAYTPATEQINKARPSSDRHINNKQ